MSLGPIEFDNSKAIFTNQVSITDDLSANSDVRVEGTTFVEQSISANNLFVSGSQAFELNNLTSVGSTTLASHEILLVNTSTGRAERATGLDATAVTNSSSTFPGMIMPYSGNMTDSNGDDATPATGDNGIFHPKNSETGAADYNWFLCNGATYRSYTAPDLRGKMLFSYGQPDAIDYALGATGGAENISLTPANVPDHTHKFQDRRIHANATVRSIEYGTGGSYANVFIKTTGGSSPYTNNYRWVGDFDGDNNNDAGGIWDPDLITGNPLTMDGRATAPGANGTSFSNMPPFHTVYFIVKAPSA